jgi:hypothetical protein
MKRNVKTKILIALLSVLIPINYLFAFPYEYESTDPFASHVESERKNNNQNNSQDVNRNTLRIEERIIDYITENIGPIGIAGLIPIMMTRFLIEETKLTFNECKENTKILGREIMNDIKNSYYSAKNSCYNSYITAREKLSYMNDKIRSFPFSIRDKVKEAVNDYLYGNKVDEPVTNISGNNIYRTDYPEQPVVPTPTPKPQPNSRPTPEEITINFDAKAHANWRSFVRDVGGPGLILIPIAAIYVLDILDIIDIEMVNNIENWFRPRNEHVPVRPIYND